MCAFTRCRDKTIVNKYMLAVNVRLFLEQREKDLMRLIKNFQEQTLADEKAGSVYLSLVSN